MLRTMIALVTVLSLSLAASAAPVVVPPGLQPGDEYRIVFATSGQTGGDWGFTAHYDQFVAAAANAAPELAALGTTWTAIVSVTAGPTDAWDHTGTNPTVSTGVPFYNTQGMLVATSNADLWDGTLVNPIEFDEQGTSYPANIWTGTDPVFGNPQGHRLGTPTPYLGYADNTDSSWGSGKLENVYQPDETVDPWHLYGMSGVLTVVPEPGTSALAVLAGLAWLPWRALSRRRNLRRS